MPFLCLSVRVRRIPNVSINMKRILLLTNIYPAKDIPNGYTPVVHYFAREWVKMGYEVRVIDYDINFPSWLYVLVRPFNKKIASHIGCVVKTSAIKDLKYVMDAVRVQRIVMTKLKPHSLCSESELKKAFDKSLAFLIAEGFFPDVILSHWNNPCLDLMARLKGVYKVPTCYVSHGGFFQIYGNRAKELYESVDVVGCRSNYIRLQFEELYGKQKPTFNCYSGIPEDYVDSNRKRSFNGIKNFIYVGTLISRKYPSVIIPSLAKVYGMDDFTLSYIGEGNEKEVILKTAKCCGVSDRVHLLGRVPREQVVDQLDKNDVFVMISKGEAFGLVYLEAMSRGCITIASKKGGFDGIIQDGVNGFLCEAGNSEDLARIISKVRNLSTDELQQISDNAIKTSCELTDAKAAKRYIENVIELTNLEDS